MLWPGAKSLSMVGMALHARRELHLAHLANSFAIERLASYSRLLSIAQLPSQRSMQ
jgi:hypothetical protein